MCHSRQPAKLAMLIVLLPFLLLCFGVGNVHCSTVHDSREDLRALLDFKQGITDDPYEALKNNWTTSTHFCRWYGVSCSSRTPYRVTGLNLTNQNLAGQVSSSLGNLTFLSILDLSFNNFTGPLPILNSLQQLVIFYLNNNQLHEVIPETLTNSSKLTYLDLSVNSLVGSIPRSISSLSSLTYLNFKTNQLEGSIPDEIANLSNTLTNLLLGGNRLSGPIPQVVFNLYNLQYLSLEDNMLGGELPSDMGALLPNLIQLALFGNMIGGRIPDSIGNVSGLELIDLGSNNFRGQIPNSLGKLSRLSRLNLVNNSLEAWDSESWGFLQALTNCRSLTYLDLGLNLLQGTLPDKIGNLSVNLQHLSLGWNNLSGILPPSIWNLNGLNELTLSNNNFSGTIEEQVGNLKDLGRLHLHDNSFVGTIPSSIGSLTKLERLELYNNDLEGQIPPTLGNLKQLSWLDLSYNKIIGDIPRDLGKLQQLTDLRVSSNKLSGEIPDTLSQCRHLVTLRMDQNFLVGNISASFSNLQGLITLNLSHNNLSGTIPTGLTNLVLLSNLDLSYNHLQGAIPTGGVFANATAISLYGNLGLCGGVMALHMPPCTAASQKTRRQYYLVKILIPIFGFMSLLVLLYFVILEKKKPRRKYLSNPYFGEHFLKVTYNDLAQATSNFSESNLVGRGSYGSVYRGKLKDSKMEVAVKVFDLEMRGAERSFLSECEALRSIQHRNLLPIITVCSTVDSTGNVFKALVYEFMANGNLDAWIHIKEETKAPRGLTLKQRINIVANIADALDYIHHDCGRPTIHCDLKPSNILLDDEMTALLGDFGISSFFSDYQTAWKDSISSVGLRGTIGYIAPEYGGGVRQASTSMDVYSFGIVLLEILTGKRPTDPIFKDELNIVSFVEGNFPHQIVHIIDDNLLEECKGLRQSKTVSKESAFHKCIMSLLQVALSCTHSLPSERMSMKEIAGKIHAIKLSYVARKEKYGASSQE